MLEACEIRVRVAEFGDGVCGPGQGGKIAGAVPITNYLHEASQVAFCESTRHACRLR